MKNTLIYILLIIFCIGILSSCEDKKKSTTIPQYNGPIMTTENMMVVLSDSGRTKIKVTTAKQLKYQNEDEFYPNAVYVTFFDKNAAEYSSLRGDSGRFHKSTNLYEIMGNVFFFNRLQQQSLNTDLLVWNPMSKRVFTDKPVVIKTQTAQLNGVGMDADQDFTKFTIKRVTGRFAVDSLSSNKSDSKPTPPSNIDLNATDTTSN